MAVKKHKPTTPGRRFATWPSRDEVTRAKPNKAMVAGATKNSGGRNAHGRITSRHRGGGAKRRHRSVDFKRRRDGIPGRVAAIEYDPNRSAHIALINYADGVRAYILAPQRLRVGDTVQSGASADIRTGNSLPLRSIPTGTTVHCVELQPGRGGQMGRSAGTAIQLVAKEGEWATLRLPSTETRMVRLDCRATIGALSNNEHQNVDIGRAGRSRHQRRRPQTRGTAMNPVDHPHGGGEGANTPGRHPVSPWGVPTLGYPTRKKSKPSNKYIVRRRRRSKKR